MRRILLIVAMLLIAAAPAMATVTVNAKHMGLPLKAGINCTTAEVNYVCGAGEKVRAFALEISVNNGYTITSIKDFNRGENTATTKGYGIFPGKFRDYVDAAAPNWVDPNYNPIAPATDADANGTGLGTNKIIVELGSLYVDTNAPTSSGILFRFDINGPVSSTTNISIVANATRGGVVLEDGNTLTATLNGHTGAGFPECFPCWGVYNTQYAQFIDPQIIKPNCWCGQYAVADVNWKYQCYGDADGKVQGGSKYRVYTSDYNKLIANWKKKATSLKVAVLGSPAICSDIDHFYQGGSKYRVYTSDYNKMIANWKKKDTQLKGAMCPQ